MNEEVISVENAFNLEGKIALVTGAGGYLGTEIIKVLAHHGCTVLVNGRDKQRLENVYSKLAGYQDAIDIIDFDITKKECISQGLDRIRQDYGKLDILVNNAYSGKTGSYENTSFDDFRGSFDVAVSAAFELMKSCKDLFIKAVDKDGYASIINIASMYGVVSPDLSIYGDTGHMSPVEYGAAKAALIQITRYMAVALGEYNIRVNSISPGPFPSDVAQEKFPELIKTLGGKVPLGRIGDSHELQGPILFLASKASSYVTGANLMVDGGWTAL